ncbi:RCC1 domain-containing protein [Actinoplanes subglobosus]|uniref:RCC1-like domain-containing protein n=1 Tax=Actinoplanes subglobosus TaxID=1547892 RepID=A0ABV8J0M1_9ACTN
MRTGLTVVMMLGLVTGPVVAREPEKAGPVVSAGGDHTCAVDGDGRVWCWGDNERGQLGDGTQLDRSRPVPVVPPAGVSFSTVTAGDEHTCGIGNDATVYCWGWGGYGQIGNGTDGTFVDPMVMEAPAGVVYEQVTAGYLQTCAIGDDTRTYCTDDDNTDGYDPPEAVSLPEGVSLTAITAGHLHTCGIGDDSRTYCWGERGSLAAVDTPDGVTFTHLTAGKDHTCAIGSDRKTYCWVYGQTRPAAVNTPAGVTFTQVDAGDSSVCAIGSDTRTYCWGGGRSVPAVVETPDGVSFTHVDSGAGHTCATTGDGRIHCWGDGGKGQLGDGGRADRPRPVRVTLPPAPADPVPARPTADLFSGLLLSCMLDDRDRTFCWGYGWTGGLGNGGTVHRARPAAVDVPAGVTFERVAVGSYHTCAIGSDTKTYCWGEADNGRLGNGATADQTRPTTAVDTPGGVTFTALAAGGSHTCAIGSDTRTYCWGANFFGKLGNGAAPDQSRPSAVKAPAGVSFTRLTAGDYHTCAIGSDARTYCWGDTDAVGDGGTENRGEPVPVRTPSGVTFTQIDAGSYHTCGVGDDSRIYCWGDNNTGQLGDGSGQDRKLPVAVKAPAAVRFVAVTGGSAHTCGLSDDHRAFCWGQGFEGRLGDSTGEDRPLPVPVLAPAGVGFTKLEAGGFSTCGLGDDRKVYCWGTGNAGELGNSDWVPQLKPVPVSVPAGDAKADR